jgi:hypothetical protein
MGWFLEGVPDEAGLAAYHKTSYVGQGFSPACALRGAGLQPYVR